MRDDAPLGIWRRLLIVGDIGEAQHVANPVPPRLRGLPISEEHNVPLEHQRSLSIALIGPPNVGKSTLLNKFLQDKVAATSSKAQTTRMPVIGFTTIQGTQLVFLDTPGIVDNSIQKKISRSLVVGSWSALNEADLGKNALVQCPTGSLTLLQSLSWEMQAKPLTEYTIVTSIMC